MFNRMNRFTSLPMKALQGADGTFPGQTLALSLARLPKYMPLSPLYLSPLSVYLLQLQLQSLLMSVSSPNRNNNCPR